MWCFSQLKRRNVPTTIQNCNRSTTEGKCIDNVIQIIYQLLYIYIIFLRSLYWFTQLIIILFKPHFHYRSRDFSISTYIWDYTYFHCPSRSHAFFLTTHSISLKADLSLYAWHIYHMTLSSWIFLIKLLCDYV